MAGIRKPIPERKTSRIFRDVKKYWLKANEMPGLLDLADNHVYKWDFPACNAFGGAANPSYVSYVCLFHLFPKA